MMQNYQQNVCDKNHGAPSLTSLFRHIPDSIRNSINLELCNHTLGSHILFRNFSQSQLLLIIHQMDEISAAPQDEICSKLQNGSYFLVIISGSVLVYDFDSVSIK
jgi:hypothetical protein